MTDLDNAPDALAQARIASGMHCVQRGDRRAARLWFAQAEQTDDPDTLVRLAAIYDRTLHDSGHAEACYHRAISHGSLNAMGNLGVLLLAQDRLEHAVRWLRRAAASGHVDALYHLARALDRRGDHDEALAPLRRAARAGHPPAMCALGLHHYLHGHPTGPAAGTDAPAPPPTCAPTTPSCCWSSCCPGAHHGVPSGANNSPHRTRDSSSSWPRQSSASSSASARRPSRCWPATRLLMYRSTSGRITASTASRRGDQDVVGPGGAQTPFDAAGGSEVESGGSSGKQWHAHAVHAVLGHPELYQRVHCGSVVAGHVPAVQHHLFAHVLSEEVRCGCPAGPGGRGLRGHLLFGGIGGIDEPLHRATNADHSSTSVIAR